MNQRGVSLGARLRSVDRLGMSKPPTSFPPCFLNWSTGVVVSAPKPGFKLVVDLGGGCHSNPMCEQCVPFDGWLESPSCLMLSEDQANVDPLRAGAAALRIACVVEDSSIPSSAHVRCRRQGSRPFPAVARIRFAGLAKARGPTLERSEPYDPGKQATRDALRRVSFHTAP